VGLTQVSMSECRQGFTFTQNVKWGFHLCCTLPT